MLRSWGTATWQSALVYGVLIPGLESQIELVLLLGYGATNTTFRLSGTRMG